MKPRKIRDCKLRISERDPRKGTETVGIVHNKYVALLFQNVTPERGRKLTPLRLVHGLLVDISERDPRKGTETMISPPDTPDRPQEFQNVTPERGRKHAQ